MPLFRRSRSTARSRRSRNSPRARPNSPAQSERAILEILLQREKLGSTAVGNGVAIPHGKLPKLGRLFGLFARLERADRFRGARRPAGRSVFSAAGAGSGGRRSPEGAGARRASAARSGDRAQAARISATPTRSTPCWRCRRRQQRGVARPRHHRVCQTKDRSTRQRFRLTSAP